MLLADEPTGNLDPATSLDIVHLLKRIHDSGTTILMATHDNTIVDRMQQRVVEIEDGVIIRDEATGGVKVVATADVAEGDIVVHDAHSPDPTMAFAISRLTDSGYLNTSPIGVFRQVQRPTYDDQAREQVSTAMDEAGDGATADRSARLAGLIGGGDTWTVL